MAGRITSLLNPRASRCTHSTKRTVALNDCETTRRAPDVANFAGFYDELLARDRLDTTRLGNAVALPHARTEHVKQIASRRPQRAGIPSIEWRDCPPLRLAFEDQTG